MTETNFANQLKEKYADKWVLTTIREDIARKWLALILGLDIDEIQPTGIGVLTTSKLKETWEGNPFRKFDFFIPRYNLYLDVTGTQFTKRDSIKRAHRLNLRGAIIAILGVKVSVAEVLEAKGFHTAFVSINDAEGEIRFMPYPKLKYLESKGQAIIAEPDAIQFARGERTYVITRWRDWIRPRSFKRWLSLLPK